MSVEGSARNKEEKKLLAMLRQQSQVRRVPAARLRVCQCVRLSIRLEQTGHWAVNLLKEVESVNASGSEAEARRGRRYAGTGKEDSEPAEGRKFTLGAAGSLAKHP